eukprot:TRINITY_DN3728_c0_g1_i1.p1 TRINITY_DN3728_c0_g1~~TRINITY_DN3728_c0_g1_i1.p1  ORF type:complete len:281 (+),score=62.78 TRINITY_DN3728_c0_g1_i1:838-1680(+)
MAHAVGISNSNNLNKKESTKPSEDYDALRVSTGEKIVKLEEKLQHNARSETLRVVHHIDTDTANRVIRANRKMSEYVHILANEPSIGLFHVCDHVSRNVPRSVETKKSLKATAKKLEDMNGDMDYTIRTVKSFHDLETFTSIMELLRHSMETVDLMRQKLPPKPKGSSYSSQTTQDTSPTTQTSSGETNATPIPIQTDNNSENNTTNPNADSNNNLAPKSSTTPSSEGSSDSVESNLPPSGSDSYGNLSTITDQGQNTKKKKKKTKKNEKTENFQPKMFQ